MIDTKIRSIVFVKQKGPIKTMFGLARWECRVYLDSRTTPFVSESPTKRASLRSALNYYTDLLVKEVLKADYDPITIHPNNKESDLN